MSMDLEEQYDKIFHYCYFKVQQREIAEDITQETFLRFLESRESTNIRQPLHYLYTIARNLCIDEYRKHQTEPLNYEIADNGIEDNVVTQLSIKTAWLQLNEIDRELLLLRYINEVPISVISKLYGISRFSVYRKILQATKNLKNKLEQEGFT